MRTRTLLYKSSAFFPFLISSSLAWSLEAGESVNGSEWKVVYVSDVPCDTCLTGKKYQFEAFPAAGTPSVTFIVDSLITGISVHHW